jgi:hypothetical protein
MISCQLAVVSDSSRRTQERRWGIDHEHEDDNEHDAEIQRTHGPELGDMRDVKRNSGGGRPAEEGLRRELFYHKDTEGTQFTEKLKDFVLLTPATRASEEQFRESIGIRSRGSGYRLV